MPVYVDQLTNHESPRAGLPPRTCHLFADTRRQLHTFAELIGVAGRVTSFHDEGVAHYDLPPGYRKRAIREGAWPVTREKAEAKWREIIAEEKANASGSPE